MQMWRALGIAVLGAVGVLLLAGVFVAGYEAGRSDQPAVKSCECRPCPCSRGDGRRTGQPTGDVVPDEKGGDR